MIMCTYQIVCVAFFRRLHWCGGIHYRQFSRCKNTIALDKVENTHRTSFSCHICSLSASPTCLRVKTVSFMWP